MKGSRQVNDAFSKRHPAVNFLFFLGVILAAVLLFPLIEARAELSRAEKAFDGMAEGRNSGPEWG